MTRLSLTLTERTLPMDLPEPVAHPTGNVYDPEQPYTLPLNQRIALARCLGPYSEIDRKIWATLVALAWDNLRINNIHHANARDIARLFRDLTGGASGSDWVMASAKRLMQSTLEWDNPDEMGAVPLLSGLRIKKSSGEILYQFPDFLVEKMLDNTKFSRIRLHFMIGLSGKYSVTLYVLLESAVNKRVPVIDLSIDELRKILSVPEGKLARWVDLNRFAIEPAIRQINDNVAAAGFSVSLSTITSGRRITHVRFTLKKSELRVAEDEAFKPLIPTSTPKTTGSHESDQPVSTFQIDEALTIIRREAKGLDAHAILAEFQNYMAGSKTKIRNPLGALTGFARKKVKNHKNDLFERE